MTGEMGWIKANGLDSNGDTWEVHAKVARALRCQLRPFDKYIGPYIAHKRGQIFLSSDDGETGTACLWPDGQAPAYREPFTVEFFPLYNSDAALAAARDVLRQYAAARRSAAKGGAK
jgi:hypothetical protein